MAHSLGTQTQSKAIGPEGEQQQHPQGHAMLGSTQQCNVFSVLVLLSLYCISFSPQGPHSLPVSGQPTHGRLVVNKCAACHKRGQPISTAARRPWLVATYVPHSMCTTACVQQHVHDHEHRLPLPPPPLPFVLGRTRCWRCTGAAPSYGAPSKCCPRPRGCCCASCMPRWGHVLCCTVLCRVRCTQYG
jgi:hypothetical protein